MNGMLQLFVIWLTGLLAGTLLGWHLGTRRTTGAPAETGPGTTDGARVAATPSRGAAPSSGAAVPAPGRLGEKPGLQRAG